MLRIIAKSRGPVFYASPARPGFSLRAETGGIIAPGETVMVPTALQIAPMSWLDRLLSRWVVFELQMRPHFTIDAFDGIRLIPLPMCADEEAKDIVVTLRNDTDSIFCYSRGDRLATGVVGLAFRARGVEIHKGCTPGGR